jgi:RNA 2',3'-cyclic 3'-phosphodiesterase
VVRLFVALSPPPYAVRELEAAVRPLRGALPEVSWTRPEQWHLTLAFLGEVDHDQAGRLLPRLERLAGRHPSLPLRLAGGGQFGGRVLWVGVTGEREGLRRLAVAVRAAARHSGLEPATAPFRPHLTVGRSHAVGSDVRTVAAQLGSFTSTEWTAGQLLLVRSHLGAGPGGGARHDVVGRWRLGEPPGPEQSRDWS